MMASRFHRLLRNRKMSCVWVRRDVWLYRYDIPLMNDTHVAVGASCCWQRTCKIAMSDSTQRPLPTRLQYILTPHLVMSRSRVIMVLHYPIAVKFRCLGNGAAYHISGQYAYWSIQSHHFGIYDVASTCIKSHQSAVVNVKCIRISIYLCNVPQNNDIHVFVSVPRCV